MEIESQFKMTLILNYLFDQIDISIYSGNCCRSWNVFIFYGKLDHNYPDAWWDMLQIKISLWWHLKWYHITVILWTSCYIISLILHLHFKWMNNIQQEELREYEISHEHFNGKSEFSVNKAFQKYDKKNSSKWTKK